MIDDPDGIKRDGTGLEPRTTSCGNIWKHNYIDALNCIKV